MFSKQSFPIQITNERLLSPKRGTIKRSTNTHNYSLRKKEALIIINPTPPYGYNETFLGNIEGKINLANENEGEYQLEVVPKPMIKFFAVMYLIYIPSHVYIIVSDIYRHSTFQLLILLAIFPTIIHQYIKTRKGIKVMTERLKEDRSIFL